MTTSEAAAAESSTESSVRMRFEVTTLPVADVDRAKSFYLALGWHLDVDLNFDETTRVVQFTPVGSPASFQFGTGMTTMSAGIGSLQNLYLIVDDVTAARDELVSRGADVSGSSRAGCEPGRRCIDRHDVHGRGQAHRRPEGLDQ